MGRLAPFSLALALACALPLSGCAKSTRQKLVGAWGFDFESREAAVVDPVAAADPRTQATTKAFNERRARLRVQFTPDTLTLTEGQLVREAKRYEVVSEQGPKLVLSLWTEGHEHKEQHAFAFKNDDTVTTDYGGFGTIDIKRVK